MFQGTLSIFGKEFSSYFRTRMAYFILLVYTVLSMATAFYSSRFFDLVNHNLQSFFFYQPEIFTILIPALTMRLWADERRAGTLELLLSQPLSYTAMVLGKFLAAWAFCALMLAFTLPLWFSAAEFVPLDNHNILASYVACLFVAGALCAVGSAVSAFNSNPVTAYLMSLAVILIIKLVNFDAVLQMAQIPPELSVRIARSLNFDNHYFNIISGQLTWSNAVYFITLMLGALWINIAAVEYKRS